MLRVVRRDDRALIRASKNRIMKALTVTCPKCGTEFEAQNFKQRLEHEIKIHIEKEQENNELLQLQIDEKNEQIEHIKSKLFNAHRTATRISPQIQGDVSEKKLKPSLEARFPDDNFERVPKGRKGADLQQSIRHPKKGIIGTILWEVKDTQIFSYNWIPKLKKDIRSTESDVGILVSRAMPKEIKDLGVIDGVPVVIPKLAPSLATIIRDFIEELSSNKLAIQKKDDKKEIIYKYINSLEFKDEMTNILSTIKTLQDELESEKNSLERFWSKREKLLEQVRCSTNSMRAKIRQHLQGIVDSATSQTEEPPSSLPPLLETGEPEHLKK